MIYFEEDGHRSARRPRADINVHIWRRIVQNAGGAIMLWPPNYIAASWIGPAVRIDAKLTAKGIGRVGCAPSDAGAIAFAWFNIRLRVDRNVKRATNAAHHQTGRAPKCVVRWRKCGIAF